MGDKDLMEATGLSRGIFSIFGGTLKKIFSFIFGARFRINITLIFLVIVLISSINDSIKTKNALPLITKMGSYFIMSDDLVYQESLKIEKKGGILIQTEKECDDNSFFYLFCYLNYRGKWIYEIGKSLFKLLAGLWFIYISIYIFGMVIQATGLSIEGEILKKYIVAIMIFYLVSFGALFYKNYDPEHKKEIKEYFNLINPLRGVIKFISIIPLLLNPIYETIKGDSLVSLLTDKENKSLGNLNDVNLITNLTIT